MTPTQATATHDQFAACPFCGGPVSHHYSGSHERVFECLAPISVCGASVTFYISHQGDEPARALAAWNRRSSVPTPMSDSTDFDVEAVAAWICEDDGKTLGPKCCNKTVVVRCAGCPHAAMSDSTVAAAGGGERISHVAAIESAIDAILNVVNQRREPGWSYRNTITTNREIIREQCAILRASLSATPADIRGLARAELRQTRVPAPAVAAITERQDSVHPAAPNSNVASLAPFSEPSACESSELPVRPKS